MMKITRRKATLAFATGFLILFASWASYVAWNSTGVNILENEILSNAESIATSKANRISFFLDERKNDLTFLSEAYEVNELLKTQIVSEKINEKLENYKNINGYQNLIIISANGTLLWTSQEKYMIGLNLNSKENNETEFGKVYNKVKKDFGVGIFDPGYFDDSELSVFVTSPVLENSTRIGGKKEIVGIIALQIPNSEIESRIKSDIGLGDLGKIYLVNRDGTVISSLESNGEQIISIKTKIFNDCFQDYNNYYYERAGENITPVKKSGIYENYVGEEVFGAHQYILETSWCAMIEIPKKEFYESLQKYSFEKFIIPSIIICLIFVILLSKKSYDIRYGGKK